jgi:hypothetical protein
MALITISGEPGCRTEEVARTVAQNLQFELVTNGRLRRLVDEEFGSAAEIPDKAYGSVVIAMLARVAREHHLVTTASGAELLSPDQFPGLLRVRIVAPDAWRTGNLMLERRLERTAAKALLIELDAAYRKERRRILGRSTPRPFDSDLILNASTADSDQVATIIDAAAVSMRLRDHGLLSPQAEAQIQFGIRLALSKHGISPPNRVEWKRAAFVHPSEEIFANLLDFYRIAWEYEPRSFPVQWDKNGKVLEAFTPDFYLPEFDLYVELTTMKQSNVTRKNRKVKLLRTIYPDVNIQVFYQKDFQNLIFKYGLADRSIHA